MQIKPNTAKPQQTEGQNSLYGCFQIGQGIINNAQKIFTGKGYTVEDIMNDEISIKENTNHAGKIPCVSLKLRIDIKNEKNEKSGTAFLNLNPKEVRSNQQKTISFKYKKPKRKFDPAFEKLPKNEKMKQLSMICHQLLNKTIYHEPYTYEFVQLLQSAIFGCVYAANIVDNDNKGSKGEKKKAIKVLSKELIELAKDKVEEDPFSEYHYRHTMSGHSNVLCCDAIFDDENFVYMVMPYAVHGDLFEVMRKRIRPLLEGEARYLFNQILFALQYLHSKQLALRDISLENVLLFENEENGLVYPVLNDPGQAIYFKVNEHKQVLLEPFKKLFGKIFRPPEIYDENEYDPTKVDIFCTGYILYFVLTKHELFRCALEKDEFWSLFKNKKYDELLKIKNGTHLSECALDLIFHLLDPDFRKRYTVAEALEHPWFKKKMTPIYNNTLFTGFIREVITESKPCKLKYAILATAKVNDIPITPTSFISYRIYEHSDELEGSNCHKKDPVITKETKPPRVEKTNTTCCSGMHTDLCKIKKERINNSIYTREDKMQTQIFMKHNVEANQKENTMMLNSYTSQITDLIERKKNNDPLCKINCTNIDQLIKKRISSENENELIANKMKKGSPTQEEKDLRKNERNEKLMKEQKTCNINTWKQKEIEENSHETNQKWKNTENKECSLNERKSDTLYFENSMNDATIQDEIIINNEIHQETSKVNIESNTRTEKNEYHERKESKENKYTEPYTSLEGEVNHSIIHNRKNQNEKIEIECNKSYGSLSEEEKEKEEKDSYTERTCTKRESARNKKSVHILNSVTTTKSKNDSSENKKQKPFHNDDSYTNEKINTKEKKNARNIPLKKKPNEKEDCIKLSEILENLKEKKQTKTVDHDEVKPKLTNRTTGNETKRSCHHHQNTTGRNCCNLKKPYYVLDQKIKTKEKDMEKTKELHNRYSFYIKNINGKNMKRQTQDLESLYVHSDLKSERNKENNNEKELLKITDTFTHLHELMSINKKVDCTNKSWKTVQHPSKTVQNKTEDSILFNKRKTLSFYKKPVDCSKAHGTEKRNTGTIPIGKRNTIDGRLYIKENQSTEALKKKLLKKSGVTQNDQHTKAMTQIGTHRPQEEKKQEKEKNKQIEIESKKQKIDKSKKLISQDINLINEQKETHKNPKNKINIKKNDEGKTQNNTSSYIGLLYESFKHKKNPNNEKKENIEKVVGDKIKEKTCTSTIGKRNTIICVSTNNIHKIQEEKEAAKIRKSYQINKHNIAHSLEETKQKEKEKEKEKKHYQSNTLQKITKHSNKKSTQTNKKYREQSVKKETFEPTQEQKNTEDATKTVHQPTVSEKQERTTENEIDITKENEKKRTIELTEGTRYETVHQNWNDESKNEKVIEEKEKEETTEDERPYMKELNHGFRIDVPLINENNSSKEYTNRNEKDLSKESKEESTISTKENEVQDVSLYEDTHMIPQNTIQISISTIKMKESITEMSMEEYMGKLKRVSTTSIKTERPHTNKDNSENKNDKNKNSQIEKKKLDCEEPSMLSESLQLKLKVKMDTDKDEQKQINLNAIIKQEDSMKDQSKNHIMQLLHSVSDSSLFESNLNSTGKLKKELLENRNTQETTNNKISNRSVETNAQEEAYTEKTNLMGKKDNEKKDSIMHSIHTSGHENTRKEEQTETSRDEQMEPQDITYYNNNNNNNNSTTNSSNNKNTTKEINYNVNSNLNKESSLFISKNERNSFNILSSLKYPDSTSSHDILSKLLQTNRSSFSYMDMGFFKEQSIGKTNGTHQAKPLSKTRTDIIQPSKTNIQQPTQTRVSTNQMRNETKLNEINKIKEREWMDRNMHFLSSNHYQKRQSLYYPSTERNHKVRVLPVHKPFTSINSKVEQISSLRRNNHIRPTQTSIHSIKTLHHNEVHKEQSTENLPKAANQKVVQTVNTHYKTLEQFKEMINKEKDIMTTKKKQNTPLNNNNSNNNNNNNNDNNKKSSSNIPKTVVRETMNLQKGNNLVNHPRSTYNYSNAFLTNHENHVGYSDNRRTVMNENKNVETKKQLNRNQTGNLKKFSTPIQWGYYNPRAQMSSMYYQNPTQIMNRNHMNLYNMNHHRNTQIHFKKPLQEDSYNPYRNLQYSRNMNLYPHPENRFVQNNNINHIPQLNRKTDIAKNTLYASNLNYSHLNNPYQTQPKRGTTMKNNNRPNTNVLPISKEFTTFPKY